MRTYDHAAEETGGIDAPVETVFAFLDDQANLSSHMSKSSPMMFGTTMSLHMEADHTRSVGSRFGFVGKAFGVPLRVEEIVTARTPPLSKAWATTAEPVLWVIGAYAMSFDLIPREDGSTLKVQIDYDLPRAPLPRLLGVFFGGFYARWCVGQMLNDAKRHFALPNHVVAS